MVPHTATDHTHPDLLPEEITDHVTGLLIALGQTADAIAARLTELGVTGHRDEADRCPIANYLTHAAPSLAMVAVLDHVIDLRTTAGTSATLPIPDPVADFVHLFDLGLFPRLAATSLPNPLADPGTTIPKEARP